MPVWLNRNNEENGIRAHGIYTRSTFNSLFLLFSCKRLQKYKLQFLRKLFQMIESLIIIAIKLSVTVVSRKHVETWSLLFTVLKSVFSKWSWSKTNQLVFAAWKHSATEVKMCSGAWKPSVMDTNVRTRHIPEKSPCHPDRFRSHGFSNSVQYTLNEVLT